MTQGKYTVNEVEERTKVAASTLRQWERRYGFPKPDRSDSGYRLYSEEDIRHIEAMKRHIADGIPASRAAELVRRSGSSRRGPRPGSDFKRELVEALMDLDENRADEVLSEAHAIHPVERVLVGVIREAMLEIGRRWHDGEIGTTTEHFASSYVQGRLRALLSLGARRAEGASVIVACAPLDRHELGALMLAVVLRRHNYQVYFFGADTPVEDLADLVRELEPAAVLISATTDDSLKHLHSCRSHLRELGALLVFGGAAFDAQPDAARALGGVYLAAEADSAVEALSRQLAEQGQVA